MKFCLKYGLFCTSATEHGSCSITACTRFTKLFNLSNNVSIDTELSSSKTPEDRYEEERKVSIAENYLEGLGIKVKTDMYGYYRDTYDILKDLGEYLSKNIDEAGSGI